MKTLHLVMPACPVALFRDSNDKAEHASYLAPSETFDLIACGRNGRAHVTAMVNGYWSTNTITMYVDRDYFSDDTAKWKITMSHSSGGRLTKPDEKHYPAPYVAIADNLDAEMNFGTALISLSQFGRVIAQHFDIMEEAYQQRRAEIKAEYEAEKVAKQALIDADAPMGVPAAKALVAEARAKVAQHPIIRVYPRGQDNFFTAACAKVQFITWTLSGSRISEEALIAKLAASSNRTTLS